MAKFNYLQTKIALAILKGKKTVPEIGMKTGESNEAVEEGLLKMQRLGLVEKEGEEYSLNQAIEEEIGRRKELEEQDSFRVRLKAFVETQALTAAKVEKSLAGLVEKMEKDPEYRIYSIEKSEPAEQENYFSGFVEANFSAKGFNSIIKFIFVFAPSAVEIVKPRKAEFTAFELQEGLLDISQWLYKYNLALKKLMKKEEIERFNKTLFQQKKK